MSKFRTPPASRLNGDTSSSGGSDAFDGNKRKADGKFIFVFGGAGGSTA